MFSHRFNSSHSTPLHPDHLWSQTPWRDRAWWLFWWFYYNLTFRRSVNLLTHSIEESCIATRKLPLAHSGSIVLWDFALSLLFLALVIVSSPSSPAPIYFKQMSYLFIACWGFALAERSFFVFCFAFFSLKSVLNFEKSPWNNSRCVVATINWIINLIHVLHFRFVFLMQASVCAWSWGGHEQRGGREMLVGEVHQGVPAMGPAAKGKRGEKAEQGRGHTLQQGPSD